MCRICSRCLRAGGINFNIQTGVGNLYRQLKNTDGFVEYELSKSGQQIFANGANAGKVSVGDVLIHYKTGDSKPYEHAMFVTKVNSNGSIAITQRNANRKDMAYPAYDGC